MYIYAYLHGFCSSVSSIKGNLLKEFLIGSKSDTLHFVNLNRDPQNEATTSIKKGFQELDSLYERFCASSGKKFRLIGSSLGGYTSALYATQHPDRVDCLFLLCPAFNLRNKLDQLIRISSPILQIKAESILSFWKTAQYMPFFRPDSFQPIMIPYSFVEELDSVEKYPKYQCRAVIFAGLKDILVTVEDIRTFLRQHPEQANLTNLVIVNDDHSLMSACTLEKMKETAVTFFGK